MNFIWSLLRKKEHNIFNREDLVYFFESINSRAMAYMQVAIIKPDTLVDSNDTSFNKINLYKIGENIRIEDRLAFFSMIKTYFQNYANSYYLVINERKSIQPLIFTVWYLGTEVRIGCFANQVAIEASAVNFDDIVNEIRLRLTVFDGVSLVTSSNEVARNNFHLIEKSIDIAKYGGIEKQEVVDLVSTLFANMTSNVTKFYFEKSRHSH